MRTLWAALAAGLLVAAEPPANDANKADLERMQGDWNAVAMVRDGMPIPDDDAQALFRTVKGERYTVHRFNRLAGKGSIVIDATKTPKTIDAFPGDTPDKKRVILGIYTFEGERLKACFAQPGKPRPTDFSAKEGSEHTMTVWEREKK